MRIFTLTICLFFIILLPSFGQRGTFPTTIPPIPPNRIVNTYTTITADLTGNSTTVLPVDDNMGLKGGDLVMVIQMQGASINYGSQDPLLFGSIKEYRNAGHYEFAEVKSVIGKNIELTCALRNDYTFNATEGSLTYYAGTQVIKVPRYKSLKIPSGTILTAKPWDGSTGGVVVIECLGDLVIENNASIDVSGLGFRGGEGHKSGDASTDSIPQVGGNDGLHGANKGESIAGYAGTSPSFLTYDLYGRFGTGAIANGGGGGGYHNGGGGGGANASASGVSSWTGTGVLNTTYQAAWNLENPKLITNSPGGGRGGYTFGSAANNPFSVSPDDPAWSGNYRRNNGGRGGRPLDYQLSGSRRVFLGGGGGSGDANNGCQTNGGAGGGLIYLVVYGSVTGAGSLNAKGEDGPFSPCYHIKPQNDAASGGGGGGSIIVQSTGNFNLGEVNADGGVGGYQFIKPDNESEGPGGGGGGGYVLLPPTAGAALVTVNGGTNGLTDSPGVTNTDLSKSFPANGATSGSAGIRGDTILQTYSAPDVADCGGKTVILTATSNPPSLQADHEFQWYDDYNGSPLSTGNPTYQVTIPTSDFKVYYLGFCKGGTYKDSIVVIAKPCDSKIKVSNDTICFGTGNPLLKASITSIPGDTYVVKWYKGASSGTVLQSDTIVSAPAAPVYSFDNNFTPTIPGPPASGREDVSYTAKYVHFIAGLPADSAQSTGIVRVLNPSLASPGPVCKNLPAFVLNGGLPATSGSGKGTYSGPGISGGMFNPANAAIGPNTINYSYQEGSHSCPAPPQTITVNRNPDITTSHTDLDCNGKKGSLTISGLDASTLYRVAYVGATPFSSALNSGGDGTIKLPIIKPFFYSSIKVTSPEGCESNLRSETIKKDPPTVVNAGPDQQLNILNKDQASIQAQLQGTSTINHKPSWYLVPDSMKVGTLFGLNPVLNLSKGKYTLHLTDSIGPCIGTDSMKIIVRGLWIPDAISPNEDKANELWLIHGILDYDNYIVEVYNRYGNVVHRQENNFIGWDGKRNGVPLPVGTYYYVVEVPGAGNFTGPLTIIR